MPKAVTYLGLQGELWVQQLESVVLASGPVLDFVHNTHPSRGDGREDFVVSDEMARLQHRFERPLEHRSSRFQAFKASTFTPASSSSALAFEHKGAVRTMTQPWWVEPS